jgi:hypothetical protein
MIAEIFIKIDGLIVHFSFNQIKRMVSTLSTLCCLKTEGAPSLTAGVFPGRIFLGRWKNGAGSKASQAWRKSDENEAIHPAIYFDANPRIPSNPALFTDKCC